MSRRLAIELRNFQLNITLSGQTCHLVVPEVGVQDHNP
jgi:hypothetical protein